MKFWGLFIFIFVLSGGLTQAQDISVPVLNLENPPAPVRDLFNTFSKIKINIGGNTFINRLVQDVQGFVSHPQNLFSTLKKWWANINNWLENNIGLSLREIFKAVANLFVWILELIIKLLKLAIPTI